MTEPVKSKVIDRRVNKFLIIENAVIDVWAARVGVYGLAVYSALCRFANSESRCFPSREKLAALLGISPRQVTRAIAALKTAGLVETEIRFRPVAGGQTSNNYILCDVPEAAAQDVVEAGGLIVQARVDSQSRGAGLTVQARVDCQSSHEQDLIKNKTHGNLCSLDLSLIKEEDLENSSSLIRRWAGADPHEKFRMLAILAGVNRMASSAPGGKLDSRIAAFRWFLAHPDRITQGDEDSAQRVMRDLNSGASSELKSIIEGLTWANSLDSTQTDQQSQPIRRIDNPSQGGDRTAGATRPQQASDGSGRRKKPPR